MEARIDVDKLYEGKCLLTFRYPDGSEIQCISTLNEEILKNLALDYVDGFVDLITRKIIPNELFIEVRDIYVDLNKSTNLSPLDEMFSNAIKRRWEDA